MAKGSKKIKKYRRTYRYYFHRKLSNNNSLNYYRAKINFSFAVFKLNNDSGSQGVGYRIGTLLWGSPGDSLKIADVLRSDVEYQLYTPIFNEVRLLGVSIQAWPSPRNINLGTAGVSHVPVGLQYRFDPGTSYNNPFMLNPVDYSKIYWKNKDLKWSPSELTTADVANKIAVPGYITLNVPADSIQQEKSPSWNCIMNIYVQFRKNKNN